MKSPSPILFTGAAGVLGRWLRPKLIERYGALRCSDVADGGKLNANETFTRIDLADGVAVDHLVAGVKSIVHFGAISVEQPFAQIIESNIRGTYNVFESAKRHGVERIVFASTNHVIGFHDTQTKLDPDSPHRPDTFYGVSKAFGEDLARLYVDKWGMNIACLRIGSALPKPTVRRALSTWLSYADLLQMITACLEAKPFGFQVLYGASDNKRRWWKNKSPIPYKPKDNAEKFAKEILATAPPLDRNDPGDRFQGGPFCALDYKKRKA